MAVPEEGPLAGRGVIERMRLIGVQVDEVTEEVGLRICSRAEAVALSVPAGAPVLVVDRTHHCGGRAVECTEIVVPAERFKLRYRFPATR